MSHAPAKARRPVGEPSAVASAAWLLVVVVAGCTDTAADTPVLGANLVFHGPDAGLANVDAQAAHPDAAASATCAPSCVAGYVCAEQGTAPHCAVDPQLQCQPCASDLSCLGGTCASVGGEGAFCNLPCQSAADGSSACPVGHACVPGPAGARCVPSSGSCSCGPSQAGVQRACSAGSCAGSQTCGDGGWTACQASIAPEVCNGLDDNCNGATDEPWLQDGRYVSDTHCGTCGTDCTALVVHGKGTCDPASWPPHCVVGGCDPGWVPSGGLSCVPIPTSACIGCASVEDCLPGMVCGDFGSGKVCAAACSAACGPKCVDGACPPLGCGCGPAEVGQKRPCSRGNPAGSCFGVETCTTGSGWAGCTAPIPAQESCNGIDDNCDGSIDEALGAGTCVAQNASGSCVGTKTCSGSSGWTCSAKVPAVETCNGQDDDCDGSTDEDFVDAATGLYLSAGHCGNCSTSCQILGPGSVATCTIVGGTAKCGSACAPGWVDANGLSVDGCECHIQPGPDEPDGTDQNCDGIDGDASKAIFVAKTGSDDQPGTRAQPVVSIQKGIALAVAGQKQDVYVANGAYPGKVELVAGISLWGGYGAGFSVRDPKAFETVLLGAAPLTGDAVTVHGKAIAGPGLVTRVDGWTIYGPVATSPGSAGIAVFAEDCDNRLQFQQDVLFGGVGAPGSAGKPGLSGSPGTDGVAGSPASDIGHAYCTANDWSAGGAGGSGCGFAGGNGGTAICPDFNEAVGPPQCSDKFNYKQTSLPIEAGQTGLGPSGGAGGIAGWDAYIDPNDGVTTSCTELSIIGCTDCVVPFYPRYGGDGLHGSNGTGGAPGASCVKPGAFVAGAWLPSSGGSGVGGDAGSGGGGGGAAGGVETVACLAKAGYDDIGGSGGGGGAGGCGGTGGAGGQGGGASIALLVVGGAPVVTGCTLSGGAGGQGGVGGTGGPGGSGGNGEPGGSGAQTNAKAFCAYKGGAGGHGGAGGAGGGGGGGCGGPAVGIAVSGAAIDAVAGWQAKNAFAGSGSPGGGGDGGPSGGSAGLAGLPGQILQVLLF